ncbi:MAG: zinc-dependent metalloprotease [bacterium]
MSSLFRDQSRWLLLALLAGLLPSTGWAAPRAEGDYEDEEAPPMMEDGGDEGMEAPPDPTAGPPFEEVIKDFKRTDGVLTFYQHPKTGQVLLAITPDQLNTIFMMSTTLNAGSGGGAFIAPMLWPDLPFYFKETYKVLQIIQPNPWVRADDGTPISRAVKTGTSESVILSLPLISEPALAPDEDDADDDDSADVADDTSVSDDSSDEGDDEGDEEEAELPPMPEGTMLIDASPLLLGDVLNLSQMGIGADPSGSFITAINSFPENTNVEATMNIAGGGGLGLFGASGITPDARSTIVKMIYCFSQLPVDNGYTPRPSDERIGYFLTMYQDYTRDDLDTRYMRNINRWNLVKKDPSAAVSDPVEPIVFWVENTVPLEYRDAVKAGIEYWNGCFEQAGFSNAIIARQMPDDADWDPADIRYNCVRWFVAPGAGFAIGPSRANPFTGQLFDADIGFSADMMDFAAKEYSGLIDPISMVQRERGKGLALGMKLPPLVTELRQAATQPEVYAASQNALAQEWRDRTINTALGFRGCDMAAEAAEDAAAGFMAAEILRPGGITEKAYLDQFVTSIVAHEIGHTLGLRHNYKGSAYHSFAELGTAQAANEGLTGSIMDYTATNLASRTNPQGEYQQTHPGPYDKAAIEYGYTVYSDSAAEKHGLDAIASHWGDPGHLYATDEDAFGYDVAMDPTANPWDLASDNMTFYQDQIQVSKELWGSLDLEYGNSGTRYQKFRQGFGWGVRGYNLASMNVPRWIGGIVHSRNRVGDPNGTLPYEPVAYAEQRAALDFLIRNYWSPGCITFAPELIQKLAVEREPDFTGASFYAIHRDLPIHDLVLGMQVTPLLWIYDPLVDGRIVDAPRLQAAGTPAMTLAELYGAARGAIWEEAWTGHNVDSYRRNLQRVQLDLVTSIVLYGGGFYPADAITMARHDLGMLKGGLTTALKNQQLDGITRAHFEESLDTINRTLNAQQTMGGFFM